MNIMDVGFKFNGLNRWNNEPKAIVAHHTEWDGASVEDIHICHRDEKGWAGIGYHYYIRFDGSIYKGRPDDAQGAHVKEFNHNSLGVAFEGNYDVRQEMPQAQFNAWCDLKKYLINKYGNMPIYGHNEVGNSACPGRYFSLDKIKYGGAAKDKGYVVTNYLPNAWEGYEAIDLEYVLKYFEGVRCYMKHNEKGMWIETQSLPYQKCLEFKEKLGSWFYSIE